MHASDRYLTSGTLADLRQHEGAIGYASNLKHGVIGKGLNDYDEIFAVLKAEGFDGWISIEDGVNGIDELRESVRFLRTKIAEYFGAAGGIVSAGRRGGGRSLTQHPSQFPAPLP